LGYNVALLHNEKTDKLYF